MFLLSSTGRSEIDYSTTVEEFDATMTFHVLPHDDQYYSDTYTFGVYPSLDNNNQDHYPRTRRFPMWRGFFPLDLIHTEDHLDVISIRPTQYNATISVAVEKLTASDVNLTIVTGTEIYQKIVRESGATFYSNNAAWYNDAFCQKIEENQTYTGNWTQAGIVKTYEDYGQNYVGYSYIEVYLENQEPADWNDEAIFTVNFHGYDNPSFFRMLEQNYYDALHPNITTSETSDTLNATLDKSPILVGFSIIAFTVIVILRKIKHYLFS